MFALALTTLDARAAWPQNVDLYAMQEQDGEVVHDRELLGASFRQLVMELGTLVSNKPNLPAETLGTYGFAVDLGSQFVLTEARDREGQASPWARADLDEVAPPYRLVPTVTMRKGLPMSAEVGASIGWISGTSTGLFGGFARVAVLEAYKPLPDVTLKLGYSGYVGNDQLDCAALDLGVTVGSSYPVGRLPGINTGHVSPYASFTTLRVRANPTIDAAVEDELGTLRYSTKAGDDGVAPAPPIALPEFGVGVQFVAGTAHLGVGAAWAPATIPSVTTSFGFTY
ncbi:MAG: hypothetical protein ABMA64_11940 [Myxococcota bacterium]